MSPSLGKKWLQKIQQCFNKKEQLAEHIEKYVSMLLKCLILLKKNNNNRMAPSQAAFSFIPDWALWLAFGTKFQI